MTIQRNGKTYELTDGELFDAYEECRRDYTKCDIIKESGCLSATADMEPRIPTCILDTDAIMTQKRECCTHRSFPKLLKCAV